MLRFRGNASDKQASPLPVLSSSCPGWVCYAEKVQGAAVLPLLSRVKSPQQVGALSKSTKYKYVKSPQQAATYLVRAKSKPQLSEPCPSTSNLALTPKSH